MNKPLNFYDRVRAILNIDESALSNEIIDYPEFSKQAEMMVKDKIKDWESFQSESLELLSFESAIIYQTAILLYPQVRIENKVEQTTNAKIERFEPENRMNELKDMLDFYYSKLIVDYGKPHKIFELS